MISKVILPLNSTPEIIKGPVFSYVRAFPKVEDDYVIMWEKKVLNTDLTTEEDIKQDILDTVKSDYIKEIQKYDVSTNVNSFSVNGVETWLDKATRVGLMNSIVTLKALNKDEMTLWLNDVSYTINVDTLQSMLITLEDYAIKCYNQTCTHISNVSSMINPNDVESYDYSVGYPNKVEFTI